MMALTQVAAFTTQNSVRVAVGPRQLSSSPSSSAASLRRGITAAAAPAGNFHATPMKTRNVTVVAAAAATEPAAEPRTVVNVELGDRSYPIYISAGLLDNGAILRKHVPGNTALIVTNETIAPLYLDRAVAALSEGGTIRVEVVILPDGEEYKSMEVLMKVFDKALEAKLDRQTTFVALGGGAVQVDPGFAQLTPRLMATLGDVNAREI